MKYYQRLIEEIASHVERYQIRGDFLKKDLTDKINRGDIIETPRVQRLMGLLDSSTNPVWAAEYLRGKYDPKPVSSNGCAL